MSNNKPKKAIDILNKAINIANNSNDLIPYELKLKAIITLGEQKEHVIEQLEQIIIAKPEIIKFCKKELKNITIDTPESNIIKGLIFYHLGEYKKSIKVYNKVIDELKDYIRHNIESVDISEELAGKRIIFADALNNKGNALCNQSKSQESNKINSLNMQALESYKEAIETQPSNKLYYCNRGKLFNDMGNLDSALQDFKAAYDLSSNLNLRKDNEEYIESILKKNLQEIIQWQEKILSLPKEQEEFKEIKQNIIEIVNEGVNSISETEFIELRYLYEQNQIRIHRIEQDLASKAEKEQLQELTKVVNTKV